MENYYIYAHYRKNSTNPFYIGKGKNRRAWDKSGRNKYWKGIVNKYGYDIIILKYNLTEKQAFRLEKEYIYYNSYLGLCESNMTFGGEGLSGFKFSEETIKKLKNRKFSKEHREKLSKARKGKSFPRKRITKNKVSKHKITKQKTVNNKTFKVIKNKRNYKKCKFCESVYIGSGIYCSESCVDFVRKKVKQEKWNKINKPIYCLETNIRYKSIDDAAEKLSLKSYDIYNVVKGSRLWVRKLTFQYI